ncbi:hypothetical protein Tco_0834407 [Tanacetum coccineum]
MGDENPIRTLGDYSKPSHEDYRNTIELLEGNNEVPLRSDTIRNEERMNEYMKALSLASYDMEEITEGKYYPTFLFILSL